MYTYKNSIQENTNIIGSAKNWNTLIKEVLQTEELVLKSGLKVSKDPQRP